LETKLPYTLGSYSYLGLFLPAEAQAFSSQSPHLCLYVPPTRNDNMLGTVIAILSTYWGEGNERTIPRSELVIVYYVYNTPIYPFKIFPLPRMIEQKLQLEEIGG
jgi:hypothetical protein